MKPSQAAKEVIDLAKAIRDYWDAELPKRHPNYPIVGVGEDSGPPPAEEHRLKQLLDGLPDDVVYKLLLIMYLGRGDFGTDELPGQYEYLRKTFAKPAWAASQLMEKAPLAEYLMDGLSELEKSGIDPDSLPIKTVPSPT